MPASFKNTLKEVTRKKAPSVFAALKRVKNFLPVKDRYPYTSPVNTIEVIKYIIQGKTVLDMGCRRGKFMKALRKYAKEVIGMEKLEEDCNFCRKSGLNVIFGDFRGGAAEIPEADVYYFYTDFKNAKEGIERLRALNRQGIVIFGFCDVYGESFLREPIINVPHSEGKSDFKLQIIKL